MVTTEVNHGYANLQDIVENIATSKAVCPLTILSSMFERYRWKGH